MRAPWVPEALRPDGCAARHDPDVLPLPRDTGGLEDSRFRCSDSSDSGAEALDGCESPHRPGEGGGGTASATTSAPLAANTATASAAATRLPPSPGSGAGAKHLPAQPLPSEACCSTPLRQRRVGNASAPLQLFVDKDLRSAAVAKVAEYIRERASRGGTVAQSSTAAGRHDSDDQEHESEEGMGPGAASVSPARNRSLRIRRPAGARRGRSSEAPGGATQGRERPPAVLLELAPLLMHAKGDEAEAPGTHRGPGRSQCRTAAVQQVDRRLEPLVSRRQVVRTELSSSSSSSSTGSLGNGRMSADGATGGGEAGRGPRGDSGEHRWWRSGTAVDAESNEEGDGEEGTRPFSRADRLAAFLHKELRTDPGNRASAGRGHCPAAATAHRHEPTSCPGVSVGRAPAKTGDRPSTTVSGDVSQAPCASPWRLKSRYSPGVARLLPTPAWSGELDTLGSPLRLRAASSDFAMSPRAVTASMQQRVQSPLRGASRGAPVSRQCAGASGLSLPPTPGAAGSSQQDGELRGVGGSGVNVMASSGDGQQRAGGSGGMHPSLPLLAGPQSQAAPEPLPLPASEADGPEVLLCRTYTHRMAARMDIAEDKGSGTSPSRGLTRAGGSRIVHIGQEGSSMSLGGGSMQGGGAHEPRGCSLVAEYSEPGGVLGSRPATVSGARDHVLSTALQAEINHHSTWRPFRNAHSKGPSQMAREVRVRPRARRGRGNGPWQLGLRRSGTAGVKLAYNSTRGWSHWFDDALIVWIESQHRCRIQHTVCRCLARRGLATWRGRAAYTPCQKDGDTSPSSPAYSHWVGKLYISSQNRLKQKAPLA